MKGFSTATDYKRTPMIRGRITALNGVPSADAKVAPDAKWALNGDRGITYAATPPEGTIITEGKWWPADYRGPTLISLDQSIAIGTGLKIGDTMKLNVLGAEFEGRIASLRKVDFTTGGQNFVLVLSPGLIDHAPHAFLATVRVDDAQENGLYMAVTDRFPNISTVRVKDAIQQVQGLLQSLADGGERRQPGDDSRRPAGAGGGHRGGDPRPAVRRHHPESAGRDPGANRPGDGDRIWRAGGGDRDHRTFAGTLGAWVIATGFLDVPFSFDASAIMLTVVGGGAATLLFGLLGSLGALSARPARRAAGCVTDGLTGPSRLAPRLVARHCGLRRAKGPLDLLLNPASALMTATPKADIRGVPPRNV